MNLQDENHKLSTELRRKNGWSDKAARYRLSQPSGGASFAYLHVGEPEHWACPTCFELEKVSVLQPWDEETGAFRCTVCQVLYYVDAPKPRRSGYIEPEV
jgi:rubredoxin